jgi:serine protease DegQ
MRRLWLLFAQTVTVGLALWFIVATLKPSWIAGGLNQPGLRLNQAVNIIEAPNAPPPVQSSFRQAAHKALPSVVNIYTTKEARTSNNPLLRDPYFRRFFGEEVTQPQASLGSGVIVSPEGYILTNNHVVESADEILVALPDNRTAHAKVIGTDLGTDLAVIKIDLPNLPAITLGHSDQASVGDVVLAIGNPFGVGQTVTQGIISALGRSTSDTNSLVNFIQTDAAINPGNSGGALVDVQGSLLGINTAIYSNSGGSMGIGFAVPVSTAKLVMESIIQNGYVVRGSLGIRITDITPELAEDIGLKKQDGVVISGVQRGGSADKAGLRPTDVLLEVDGKSISSTKEVWNLIVQLTPGAKAKVKVLRGNKEMTLDVVIGSQRPANKAEE